MSTLVLALNPSIDVEWQVNSVHWEEKNIIQSERRWPGGKGVNVARWLRFLGGNPTLLLPLGGRSGEELKRGLRLEKIKSTIVPIKGETRANIIVSTNAKRQLRFNPVGPEISRLEWKTISAQFECAAKRASVVVLTGSLPRGISADAYQKLLLKIKKSGAKAVLDCDGEALKKAVSAKPFLVKPNEFELAQWANRPLKSEKSLISAAKALSAKTGGWVLVSRGARGAILLNETTSEFFAADALPVKVRNTVGAGDAMVAAVAQQIEKDQPPQEWLNSGIAVSSAAVQCEAGTLPKIAP